MAPPGPWLDRGLCLVPALFAVPVLGSIGVSVARLLLAHDPDPAFGTVVNADAAELSLGGPLYQDPESGYSGILYMPFLPAVVSLFLRAGLTWTGWPLLITILATLAMVGVVARLTYRPQSAGTGDRLLAGVEALGLGALGWVLLSCIQLNGIYGGNGLHDEVAWAFGLGGLVLLPAAARGSRPAFIGAVLLLTAAFWTKQNALIASVAAALWLFFAAAAGAVGWRRAGAFCLSLLGLNVALLGLANVLTGGWELVFNFVVPSRHPLGDLGEGALPSLLPKFLLDDLLPAVALTAAWAGGLWLVVALARPGSPRERVRKGLRRLGAELRRPAVVALPLLVGLGALVWFRQAKAINFYFLTAPGSNGLKFVEGLLIPGAAVLAIFGATLATVLAARRAIAAARGRRTAPASWAIRATPTTLVTSVLVLLVAVAVPASLYFRQKIGADDNYYVGVSWALAMLGAVAYRRARRARGTAVAAGGLLVLLFVAVAVVSPTAGEDGRENAVNLPSFDRATSDTEQEEWLTVYFPRLGLLPLMEWVEIPPELRAYARSHLVYSEGISDLNARPQGLVWPSYDNFSGDLAGGLQPAYLVEGLLNQRFDAVSGPFGADERREQFTSGSGRWEENYLWKLNAVIEAGYRKSAVLPENYWARRAGPPSAPWMRACFGPFDVAGARFRINRGGGFWCRPPSRPELELRRTPAPYSDVRTDAPVYGLAGKVSAALGRGRGLWQVTVEPGDGAPVTVRATPSASGTVELRAQQGPRALGRVRVPARAGHAVTLAFAPATGGAAVLAARNRQAVLALPPLEGGILRLGGTRDSGARFDLSALRVS